MKISAPRGTLDVLPADAPARTRVIDTATRAAGRYGYAPMVIPTFEETELFARTAGEGSDVVTKEMYTFTDRGDRSLTLRPEATAGICRAYVEHGLHKAPQPFKAFFCGPMFRYAAPQKGRYREFWQVDVEAVGSADPAVDAEQIQLFHAIAAGLGIEGLRLELNSIGCRACRPAYVEQLSAWLATHDDLLDDEAREKAAKSPLRVFDVKSERVRAALREAPAIGGSLCAGCRDHFAAVTGLLDAYGVGYVLVPTLVRGLDYYARTVFEFVNDGLGAAQATVCAGGRYDYLVEDIGGPPTPAIGWAAGVERLAMSLPEGAAPAAPVDVFVAFEPGVDRTEGLTLVRELRQRARCEVDLAGRSLKGQLTQAGRLGAEVIVIVGEHDNNTLREPGHPDRSELTMLDVRQRLARRFQP